MTYKEVGQGMRSWEGLYNHLGGSEKMSEVGGSKRGLKGLWLEPYGRGLGRIQC